MGELLDKSFVAALLKRIEALELDNARLQAENVRLKLELAAAKKNSKNSSKPPSSDIVKPPPARFFDERVKNGFGVMADDFVAGLYTVLVLAVLRHVLAWFSA